MPAPYNHGSGLSGVYDRTPDRPDWARVLFREDRIAQAAEMMEAQSIIEGRGRRIADRIMTDGDRISGADAIVNVAGGTVTLTAGQVYARGDVRSVLPRILVGVPMTGDVTIGIRITKTTVTEVQDPALLGLHPGTEAEGEAGAGREVETAIWGFSGDGAAGDLLQVYLLKDGVLVDQTPPPILSGVNQALALYDRDAHGSYIVRGCSVRALGLIGGAQHFSIGEGTANINGFKRTRQAALRHIQAESFDTETVSLEPHTFVDGGSGTAVVPLNRGPLNAIVQATITKQKTVTLTKGVAGGLDALPDGSVSSIVSVVQGGTTYVAGTSYVLNADRVDWSPAGIEPAAGSSYQVTYQYLAAVTPTATTQDTVTLTGGVTGGNVFITYSWKLPRTDLLCLNSDGQSVYVKGVSSRAASQAPGAPTSLLALAEVQNNWRGTPTVVNTDVRSVPFIELWAYIRRLFDALDLVALERLRRDIDQREPVAKKGVFVDPWTSDNYRDAGVTQTGAVFNGQMTLPITPTITRISTNTHYSLDWTEEVLLQVTAATGCMKVNPYANFLPLPGAMTLNPALDFWTDFQTVWTSPATREILLNSNMKRTWVTTETVNASTAALEYLRQLTVTFTITGFGAGEALSSLTFDGVSVTPAGPLTADSGGNLTGTFVIPANIPAGVKEVAATGAGGTLASASFSGQGEMTTTTLRQVTTTTRQRPRDRSRADPLAQTFTLIEPRQIVGVDLRVCAVGNAANPLLVEIHEVENGWPTSVTLAQVIVPMTGVTSGTWVSARWPVPLYLPADREFAIVVKTDDANHAVSIAQMGGFDAVAQQWVSAQPYAVGVLLSSSNASTWTPHQDADLCFKLVGAKFAPTTKTVSLVSTAVVNMSDLLILAGIETPTEEAGVVFEVQRADGSVTRLLNGQLWQLDSFVSETLIFRAILTGSDKISPILFPSARLIAGKQENTGTYVSRAFDMGASIRMSTFVKTKLPAGSTLTVEVDANDGAWVTVAQFAATVLGDGWTEREYRKTPYTATQGRLRLTLTGTPAARPVLSDFRAISV